MSFQRAITYIPTLGVLILITYLSLLRQPSFSLPPITGADKWAHIGMYACLSLVFVGDYWRDCHKHRLPFSWHTLLIIGSFALYGGLIEILQENFFYPRTGTVGDWLADIAGCIIGCLFLFIVWKRTRKN